MGRDPELWECMGEAVPHLQAVGVAEGQDIALALFSFPVASREQQNSSPGSAQLPPLGSGEGD